MKANEINNILKEHKLWVKSCHAEGSRADLSGADLHGANLNCAVLSYADLHSDDVTLRLQRSRAPAD